MQATVQDCPVTLIAYDVPYPEPLHAARPVVAAFATALVLAPQRTGRAIAALRVVLGDVGSTATRTIDPELERLRLGNPAARALPLLTALARGDAGTLHIGGVEIEVVPA